MTDSALDTLCARFGIASQFTDTWGREHVVAERSKRELLRAMGIAAADDEQVQVSLARVDQRSWQEVLPPVSVFREESATELSLTLPEAMINAPLRWVVTEESGQRHEGDLSPQSMINIETHRIGAITYRRWSWRLELHLPLGYHVVRIHNATAESVLATMVLIIAPGQCYRPAQLSSDTVDTQRIWGPALQLYGVRSQRNFGIGDFTDLKGVVEFAAAARAGFVGLSPLHALFLHNPDHASPYSPSSRGFLNALYLDVEAVATYLGCDAVQESESQAKLRALRSGPLVDYAGVASAKMDLLHRAYNHFRQHLLPGGASRARDFATFQRERGARLRLNATYDALLEHFSRGLVREKDAALGWLAWPEAYRDPASSAVTDFVASNIERIEFFEFLQWQADLQLDGVGRRSMELGLAVGLYQDLAVGVDRNGADVWAEQALYALEASIGAPPDDFNLKGQDWDLPPPIPARLRDAAYAPFVEVLRANMRHAGALRIDHVTALMRLYWIPAGATPDDGTYVYYSLEDLLGILALESVRNKCLVVGEDLGTVPERVHVALRSTGILSYRLFYFERDENGGFKAPAEYPSRALVAVGNHDLHTLAGYWKGADLDLRRELNLFPNDAQREKQVVGRAQDRARVLVALERERLLPPGVSVHDVSIPEMTAELACAIHVFLARTPARMLSVQPEDVFEQLEQMNLPGTTSGHPNWRRKLVLNLEDWAGDPRMKRLVEALAAERPAPEAVRSASVQQKPASVPLNAHIPRATYRLQFNREFTFAQARQIVPYLSALGISHCYASPYLKARSGSRHGYDIVDHNAFNTEIGSADDFEGFVAALKQHGMAHILDMVPNHMGVFEADNAWWLDVLENGPAASHASFFDIDWEPLLDAARGKVLLPVLGDHYGVVLDRGELKLVFDGNAGEFSVFYFAHRFPISPREYPRILGHRFERLRERLAKDDPFLLAFESLITAFGHLPGHRQTTSDKVAERARDKEIHKRQLAAFWARSPDIARFIDENIVAYNGTPGDPQSFALLHDLLEVQAYRLAYWRVASHDINYRRFFDINDLAALRMENPAVFEKTHELVFKLLTEGKIDGLRIDHPDGLYDPHGYFSALQQRFAAAGESMSAPTLTAASARALYVVVEKILANHERLPQDWPVHGTTGYEFGNLVNGLFVDAASEADLDHAYATFVHRKVSFDELLYRSKKLIMQVSLASELNVLANQLQRIALDDRRTRDFTVTSLRDALAEIVACFPVYRTYIARDRVSDEDRRYVDWAVGVAKRRSQAADVSVFDFVRDVLLVVAEGRPPAARDAMLNFAMKFQQYTGPVMAKGLEDTSFYNYHRLVSLNDVGGDPRRFATSVDNFHRANQRRLEQWPYALLATSTHDSKRSEDVRARINVLSEAAEEWRQAAQRWRRLNRGRHRQVEGEKEESAPSHDDEYLFYQTLVGAWPMTDVDEASYAQFCTRMQRYMLKAVREAKARSSWLNPNAAYEKAVGDFVKGLLERSNPNRFLDDFAPFARRIARFGMLNSLAVTLLKLCVPGVPDFYQGSELWQLTLVDPDNRGAVDFVQRACWLAELQSWLSDAQTPLSQRLKSLLNQPQDGRVKLYLTWRALQCRREHEDVFRRGTYQPLATHGTRAENVIAFGRVCNEDAIIVVVPRLAMRLDTASEGWPQLQWDDTRIELPRALAGQYQNALTDETVAIETPASKSVLSVGSLLAAFPVALLVRHGA